jgi:hypothetical protein
MTPARYGSRRILVIALGDRRAGRFADGRAVGSCSPNRAAHLLELLRENSKVVTLRVASYERAFLHVP